MKENVGTYGFVRKEKNERICGNEYFISPNIGTFLFFSLS